MLNNLPCQTDAYDLHLHLLGKEAIAARAFAQMAENGRLTPIRPTESTISKKALLGAIKEIVGKRTV